MDAPVYLDNHATTRCDPAVVEAMAPYWSERFANPASRSHGPGAEARAAVEAARSAVAGWIGASPKELVFTSGATESDNLALLGAARARRAAEGRDHVVTLATEHPAVLDCVAALGRQGHAVTVLPVGADGLVDPDDVAAALRPTTAVVSVMLVNNEIGVMQPVAAIAERCRARGVWVHCDAAQAASVPVDVEALGVDLLSLSAHKLYGPKGIGALYVRRTRPRIVLEPLQYGGGHERGLRSGTLPTPLAVGFGRAAELLVAERPAAFARLAALRDRLWDGLRAELDGLTLVGAAAPRAPCNLNVVVEGVEAAALLMAVRRTVSLSTGSACASEQAAPSHVLRALGLGDAAQQAIRVGVGRFTTEAEIDRALAALVAAVRDLRRLSGLALA
ncbi:MAG: cysteine desulfurase family protein [Myxococcota bacterium]